MSSPQMDRKTVDMISVVRWDHVLGVKDEKTSRLLSGKLSEIVLGSISVHDIEDFINVKLKFFSWEVWVYLSRTMSDRILQDFKTAWLHSLAYLQSTSMSCWNVWKTLTYYWTAEIFYFSLVSRSVIKYLCSNFKCCFGFKFLLHLKRKKWVFICVIVFFLLFWYYYCSCWGQLSLWQIKLDSNKVECHYCAEVKLGCVLVRVKVRVWVKQFAVNGNV